MPYVDQQQVLNRPLQVTGLHVIAAVASSNSMPSTDAWPESNTNSNNLQCFQATCANLTWAVLCRCLTHLPVTEWQQQQQARLNTET